MTRKPPFARLALVALTALLLSAASAFAQSGIAGAVADTSGAMLPGVTVEAASPALIEKVRTVVTDGSGRYNITDLRPGTYSVTFSLAGFGTVRREGIELSANFTAPVSVELKVGEVSETITVSGESPLVDVQNVSQQQVITAEVVSAIPTARTFHTVAQTIPGVTLRPVVRPSAQDVGGSAGDQSQLITINGSRSADMQNTIEGMPMNNSGAAGITGIFIDMGAVQEMSFQTGAISAEMATGGVHVNFIPKEGGNRYSGSFFTSFSNSSLQSDNATDELRARGLTDLNRLEKVWDLNPAFGGPIKSDKLWFFASTRYWGLNDWVAGMYYDTNPSDYAYTPDTSRQAIDDSYQWAVGLRLTWQATKRNKFNFYGLNEGRCLCHGGVSGTTTPEGAAVTTQPIDDLYQVTWAAPVSNRLLLDGGFMIHRYDQTSRNQPELPEGLSAISDSGTGITFRRGSFSKQQSAMYNYRGAMSYVTGSHNFKTGVTLQTGYRKNPSEVNNDMTLSLLNGVPRQVTVSTTPSNSKLNLEAALGLYAQHQWTLRRFTLNSGIRYDYQNESNSAIDLPPVRYVGARVFPAIPDVPSWHDLSPRLGGSYDLFGNGKTALKVTLSRYVAADVVNFAQLNNPISTSVNTATRSWGDTNGDFIPQESELGPISNSNFGKQVITTQFADDVRTGWGVRGYNWETSATAQHEVRPGLSVSGGYHRRWYGNFRVTDNLYTTPADFDPYCVTTPVNPGLPGGGGQQLCGFFDIKPSLQGLSNNLVSAADNFGTISEVYNGGDLSVSLRLPQGGLVQGGISSGRTVFDNCEVTGLVDNPINNPGFVTGLNSEVFTVASPSLLYCHREPPFLFQGRFLASVRLPWSVQFSGTFQSLKGPEIRATWTAPNSAIAPSLGRNLSSGANGTATLELIEPATEYEDRVYQIDLRMTRIFRFGGLRMQPNFDIYNALNASPVLVRNNTYGPNWGRPTYVMPGRLFKFGAQFDF